MRQTESCDGAEGERDKERERLIRKKGLVSCVRMEEYCMPVQLCTFEAITF